MPRLLYPWGSNPWYPLNKIPTGGLQSLSECGGEEKNSLPLLGMECWSSSP